MFIDYWRVLYGNTTVKTLFLAIFSCRLPNFVFREGGGYSHFCVHKWGPRAEGARLTKIFAKNLASAEGKKWLSQKSTLLPQSNLPIPGQHFASQTLPSLPRQYFAAQTQPPLPRQHFATQYW